MKVQRLLQLHTYGEDVKYLQSLLKDNGFFNSKIDGYFGQDTLVSVTNFQRKNGIKVDGIVGKITINRLLMCNLPKKLEIPNNISYSNQNGLIIYDELLDEHEYIKEITPKDTIFLHHTSGGSNPINTISGWEKDHKKDKAGNPILDAKGNLIPINVGTSYVIGRSSSSSDDNTWDGKIIRAFDDKYWCYHLGISTKNSKALNSKSIGIEICNYGGLKLSKDGRFYNYVNKVVNDKDVVKLNTPFRGYEYFEKYTEKQIDSTRKLIVYLINKYDIKIEGKIYNEKWFDYNTKWCTNGGIRSHSQVRSDKSDIFPQLEMIQMLNSL